MPENNPLSRGEAFKQQKLSSALADNYHLFSIQVHNDEKMDLSSPEKFAMADLDLCDKRFSLMTPAVFMKVLLQFLRYDQGEYFKMHLDGTYVRENGERSYLTFQLYLNEGFEGGATTFFGKTEEENVAVIPKTGSVLIFQHDILHEVSVLKKGRKYSMRTDVMYAFKKRMQTND